MVSIHRTNKKGLHDPDNNGSVTAHLEPDTLECEVKWALGCITTNKASGGDGIPAELFQILQLMYLQIHFYIFVFKSTLHIFSTNLKIRRDKEAFLSDQGKEIEENNRMGKARDLFKKIRDIKGTFHVKMGSKKDRNGMDLREAEDIKKK